MAFSGPPAGTELTAGQQMRITALESALSFHLYRVDEDDDADTSASLDTILRTATQMEIYLREGT